MGNWPQGSKIYLIEVSEENGWNGREAMFEAVNSWKSSRTEEGCEFLRKWSPERNFKHLGRQERLYLGAIGILHSSALGGPGWFKWPFLFFTGKHKNWNVMCYIY